MSTISSVRLTPGARKRWQQVPDWAKEEILQAVWCSACLAGTPMQLREGRMEERDLILEGTCRKCGTEVARLIEPEE
jgi:hypothetical protein